VPIAPRRSASLSVGIPAYNQGAYLRETIESVLRQDEPPDEIVVSDNHSTDDTAAVLAGFGDAIRVVRPSAHLGMMAHWNFLVRELRHEWIALLSSDDRATARYTAALRAGIVRHADAVLVRGAFDYIDGDGVRTGRQRMLSVRRFTRPPRTYWENLAKPKVSFAAFALRRTAWESAGGFPEEFHLFGDWALWLMVAPLGPFVYEAEIIAEYRVSYRPGLYHARVVRELEDETRLFLDVAPRAARALGVANPARIRRVARRKLLQRLAQGSVELAVGDRTAVADAMRRWAAATGLEREVARFAAGETIVVSDPWLALRRRVRAIAGRLRG
jgi:glycosyltransferase involved in cell wall biosynthesis